jgi:hypothetical protein
MKTHPVGDDLFDAERQTTHDTTVALRDFAKRPTKYQCACAILYVTSHEGKQLNVLLYQSYCFRNRIHAW